MYSGHFACGVNQFFAATERARGKRDFGLLPQPIITTCSAQFHYSALKQPHSTIAPFRCYSMAGVSTLTPEAIAHLGISLIGDIQAQAKGIMKTLYLKMQRWLSALWTDSRPLTFVGVLMLCDVAACLVAMIFDHRQITGFNAWLKPAKFGLSIAVTCFSLAWIAGYLRDWQRIRDWSGRIFAASIAIEIVVIDLQAARGTTSHFNMATPFDRMAFVTMGISIGILWLAMVGMTYALMRQKLQPVSWGWALRLGLLLSVVGAAGGGFMLRQTPEQKRNPELKQFGSHTVGAPDGGAGLPVLNWSENHGDLREAHFLGLHGVQIISFFGWWLLRKRRLTEPQRTRLIWLASGTYVSCFGLLAWQALRGQALLQPDQKTLVMASLVVLFAGIGSGLALSSTGFSRFKKWAAVLEVHS
jgi:hypothetical protein